MVGVRRWSGTAFSSRSVAKWAMHSDLIESFRDEFGASEYHLMIRQGKTMLFTGTIGIGPRPGEPWPTLEPR